jgi:hypothetical protein
MFTHFARRYEYLHCRARTVSLLAPASPSDHNQNWQSMLPSQLELLVEFLANVKRRSRNGPASSSHAACVVPHELAEMGMASDSFRPPSAVTRPSNRARRTGCLTRQPRRASAA